MTPFTSHALACASAPARPDSTERHLSRYRKDIRLAAHALASRHTRLAELSVSFPALFVALAVPRARFDPAAAIASALIGAPLAEIAGAAHVPLWLRRMTPEMFAGPLPGLPDSLFLRRRIANHLPSRARFAPNWLDVVSKAASLAHDPFALWCAALCAGDAKGIDTKRFELLSLWAWFSTEPSARAHGFIERAWSPDMQMKAALASAQKWIETVSLYANLGDEAVGDTWLRPGNVDGYDFRPLRSAEEIAAEGAAMGNCARNYGYSVAHGRCRLWSVQRKGVHIAMMCTCWRGQDPFPWVCQLELPKNRQAPPEIWTAARKWLHGQDLLHLNKRERQWTRVSLNRAMWLELWRPYWLAKRRFPRWLPLAPSREALDNL